MRLQRYEKSYFTLPIFKNVLLQLSFYAVREEGRACQWQDLHCGQENRRRRYVLHRLFVVDEHLVL